MKRIIILSIVISLVAISCKTPKLVQKDYQKYFPEEFKQLYFGMPLEDFIKFKKIESIDLESVIGFRTEYTEKAPNAEIKEVIYYFDNDTEGKPLYEMIINYNNFLNRDRIASNLLGKPNAGKEWEFPTDDGYKIKVWKYKTKLIIIGTLKGTEWNEDE